MRSFLILLMAVFAVFFIGCGDDTPSTPTPPKPNPNPAPKACVDDSGCNKWEECIDSKCKLRTGHCVQDSDCTKPETCNTTSHKCEKQSSTPTVCRKGEKKCDGKDIKKCKDDGSAFEVEKTCEGTSVCDEFAFECKDPNLACVANSKRCNGNSIEVCESDGSAWKEEEKCSAPKTCNPDTKTCEEAATVCTPDAKRCNYEIVEVCKKDGSGWRAEETCKYPNTCDEATVSCLNKCVGMSFPAADEWSALNQNVHRFTDYSQMIQLTFDIRSASPKAVYDLGSPDNSNNSTCKQCVWITKYKKVSIFFSEKKQNSK